MPNGITIDMGARKEWFENLLDEVSAILKTALEDEYNMPDEKLLYIFETEVTNRYRHIMPSVIWGDFLHRKAVNETLLTDDFVFEFISNQRPHLMASQIKRVWLNVIGAGSKRVVNLNYDIDLNPIYLQIKRQEELKDRLRSIREAAWSFQCD